MMLCAHPCCDPSSHLLWNVSAENEGGVCQFSPINAKNRAKKVRLVMFTHICTYPVNLAKIGPIDS